MKANGYDIGPGANLRGADLQDAYLRGANLRGANLRGADLQDAYLQDAYLRGTDLQDANLQDANLQDANLQGAELQGANLQDANLQWVNLQDANLQWVNLQDANLQGANLRWANLQGANLQGANLQDAKLPHFQIPQEGSLVVWKKVSGVLVKLEIPANAARTANLINRKCRAERALVVWIDGWQSVDSSGEYGPATTYRVGKEVSPDKYDPDFRVDCSHGIHFFLTREEAEEWI